MGFAWVIARVQGSRFYRRHFDLDPSLGVGKSIGSLYQFYRAQSVSVVHRFRASRTDRHCHLVFAVPPRELR